MQEKKKVLFIITKGNFGGAQRYVYDLACRLPKEQYEVVVTCGEGQILKEKLKEKNIKVIDLISAQRDINFIKDFKTFFEILKIIKEERPYVVHLNSSKTGGLGALAGRIAGTPRIIFTSHGWAFNENRNVLSKILISILHWFTIILSHSSIAVSEKAKKDVIFMPFVKDKIKTIYNGIEKFKTLPKEETRQILSGIEASNRIIIFTIAELHKNKGIDIAIKALSLLPTEAKEKIIYSVAGDGEEREGLEKLSQELRVKNLVRFLGFVPNAKELLSGGDIFLLPSRTEAFPYALLEAGIVGLPIIATNVGGVPEVIHDMQNGVLIHPQNPKETAEAILYLLDHARKQKEFGSEIKKTVLNFFSLDKMLEETMKSYQ